MYNLETYKEPFWAKSGNYTRGRDPLGVQNSSISVYATLLPGMTNLTLRLRYYGLYLWLLDEYDKLPTESSFVQNINSQYTFIRRAELIVALLMCSKFPNEQSIIGSNFAKENYDDFNNSGTFDIGKGADKNEDTVKGSVYWDYTSGALGQYYAGSLIALNLIEMREGYFFRTEDKGVELANAYRNSISQNAVELFLKRIIEGKLKLSDVDKLEEFAINQDYHDTDEGKFYLNMLLSDDGKKHININGVVPQQRKETIAIFLRFLKEQENNNWENLPKVEYLNFLTNSDVNGAQFGWYYYYLNELTHFCIESIFWGLLHEMDKELFTIKQFSDYIEDKVHPEILILLKTKETKTIEESLSLIQSDTNSLDYISKIEEEVKNKNPFKVISLSIIFLQRLYNDNLPFLDRAKTYAITHSLDEKNGNALSIFSEYIETKSSLRTSDYISYVVLKLINEHTRIAYAKMGNGDKNLLKFIVEDNYLVHIETMEPNFTNPRLRTLYNFTRDLGLVDNTSKLSNIGKDLFNKLVSDE